MPAKPELLYRTSAFISEYAKKGPKGVSPELKALAYAKPRLLRDAVDADIAGFRESRFRAEMAQLGNAAAERQLVETAETNARLRRLWRRSGTDPDGKTAEQAVTPLQPLRDDVVEATTDLMAAEIKVNAGIRNAISATTIKDLRLGLGMKGSVVLSLLPDAIGGALVLGPVIQFNNEAATSHTVQTNPTVYVNNEQAHGRTLTAQERATEVEQGKQILDSFLGNEFLVKGQDTMKRVRIIGTANAADHESIQTAQ